MKNKKFIKIEKKLRSIERINYSISHKLLASLLCSCATIQKIVSIYNYFFLRYTYTSKIKNKLKVKMKQGKERPEIPNLVQAQRNVAGLKYFGMTTTPFPLQNLATVEKLLHN